MDANVTVAPETANTQAASDSWVSNETVLVTLFPSSSSSRVYVPVVNMYSSFHSYAFHRGG